jgi:hypothetical protein
MAAKNFGGEGFKWFIGVVEDRNDPLQQGRVRVRAYGIHPEQKALAPTDTLPWAIVLMPGTSPSLKRGGISATGLQLNSTVVGFFLDGNETTMPVVFGVMPGKDDISLLAIGQQSLNKQATGPEPQSAYRAKYPFNKVVQTESGHVFEVDDTPNFERLHTYHRSGTYSEINESGQRVNKIVGDDFEIVEKNKTVYVQGNVNVVVKGSVNMEVTGTVTATAASFTLNGDVQVNGTINSTGNVTGGGISLVGHVHPDPQGGKTSAPSP